MKLPSKLPTIQRPVDRSAAPSGRVLPQSAFSGHCEQICVRIADPVLRERCLRSCGY